MFDRCAEQVENLLGTQAPTEGVEHPANPIDKTQQPVAFPEPNNIPLANPSGEPLSMPGFPDPSLGNLMNDFGLGATDEFSWDMISLGLEEPLPSQDIIAAM